jgi:hypothetical protein
LFRKIGFTEIEFVEETGFNSSPITKGALFRANKKVQLASLTEMKATESPGECKEESVPKQEASPT